MRSTIDRAGRVVVPKRIREQLRLLDGGEVEITERDGVIEIVPVALDARIIDTSEGPVAVAPTGHDALTDDVVRRAIDTARR
ncbi:MAG: AbrB/MazE/SpoVT family DNA-binding domain-containing protein [Actinomycetota bacterium]|nr:AbrB/MazE/SpoVT family DNA-binding domain-containing protein [Actinomycetota bacterium]